MIAEKSEELGIESFDFDYPEDLIALTPSRLRDPLRTLVCVEGQKPVELKGKEALFERFQPNDCLVYNTSRVIKCRVRSTNGIEVTFIQPESNDLMSWSVLLPGKGVPIGSTVSMPGGVFLVLKAKGLPQFVEVSEPLNFEYFNLWGEFALPPYIQKARERFLDKNQNSSFEDDYYQTEWSEQGGSLASPTASLHFSLEDLELLRQRGVLLIPVTLHVGLGTFLPIKSKSLEDHKMHLEWVEISPSSRAALVNSLASKGRRYCLGTTALRAVESVFAGKLDFAKNGGLCGKTDLFIRPGFCFQWANVLMTNFHQPRSTLLVLLAAFFGRKAVLDNYQWAIERRFKLFSYGDLSIWEKDIERDAG